MHILHNTHSCLYIHYISFLHILVTNLQWIILDCGVVGTIQNTEKIKQCVQQHSGIKPKSFILEEHLIKNRINLIQVQ